MEELQIQFKNVEDILSIFSKEAGMNYYQNKESLRIDTSHYGKAFYDGYIEKTNTIVVKNSSNFSHELWHMAFSNREKYETEIYPGIYLSNGICYKKEDSNYLYGLGLTEGFAESLASKAGKINSGRVFEKYVVELLESIYGKTIYEFPLRNDPIGFYQYTSHHMGYLCYYLDKYVEIASQITRMITNYEQNQERYLLHEIEKIKRQYLKTILMTIKSCIQEYHSHLSPKISSYQFQAQIEKLFSIEELQLDWFMTSTNYNIKEEIDMMFQQKLEKKKKRYKNGCY